MDETFDSSRAIDKAHLKALSARSNGKGLAQLASHVAALAITTGLIAWSTGTAWLLPAMALHGLVLIFLFAPLHETVHRTAFASRWLNDAVAHVCGFLLLLPADYFRLFHFAHHRFTQDPARDPELAAPKPQTLAAYLLHVSALPLWRDRIAISLKHAVGAVDEPYIAAHQRAAIVTEARVHLVLYASIAATSVVLADATALLYWVVPALIGQPVLRLYLLAEHTGCPLVPDMLQNSRTTRSNAVVRWLVWNMPFHAEHHAYPALPFHALPQAHALLRDRIAVQAPGYIAVHRELIRSLRRPRVLSASG